MRVRVAAPGAVTRERWDLRGLRTMRRAAAAAVQQARYRQPCHRQQDQQVAEVLPIHAVRAERLRRVVPRLAVREDVRFGELVESVDHQLHDEDQQEYRGDLEEAREVDPVAV